VLTAEVEIGKLTVLAPPATLTVDGSVHGPVPPIVIVSPEGPVAPVSVTVQVSVFPPTKLVGENVTPYTLRGRIVSVAVAVVPLKVAVMVLVFCVFITGVVICIEALVWPSGITMLDW
jgi:hypothetical protein